MSNNKGLVRRDRVLLCKRRSKLLKVVVYFGDNHFVPLYSNFSVIKVSHYTYLCNISVMGLT